MNQDDLRRVLNKHADWVEDKQAGCEADLRGADLRGVDLRAARLYGADLREANLCEADREVLAALDCAEIIARQRGWNVQ